MFTKKVTLEEFMKGRQAPGSYSPILMEEIHHRERGENYMK
jgi:hypothetical protein